MRNNTIYGRLAREEIEAVATAPGEEVAAAQVEAGADSLEADIVEVNNDIVDVTADTDSTDQAADIVDEMEVAAESLRDIARNGGLDRNGARVLNLYQASINRRLGLPANHKTVSAESFGGSGERAGRTSLAAEAFSDKAKELWAKLVEWFKKAWEAIKGVWNRIFDGATRMKARAEKVAKAAGDSKADASGKTFENAKLAENLHINGTVDVKAAAAEVANWAPHLKEIAQNGVGLAGQMNEIVKSGDLGKIAEIAKKSRSDAQRDSTKVADAASVGLDNPGEGLEMYKGDALPGNKTIVSITPAEGANAEAFAKITYKLGAFDTSKKVADKLQLKALSGTEGKAVAEQIGKAAEAIIGYKQILGEADKKAKEVISAAEAKAKEQAKAAPKEGEAAPAAGEGQATPAGVRALARGAMNLVTNSIPPLAGYLINAGGYCLQYVEQSLKVAGAAAKDAKPAEGAPAAEPAAA